jgi:hypothetical protein
MIIVGAIAVDFAVIRMIGRARHLAERAGFFGILPMMTLLAFCVAIVVSGLRRRGEIALSLFTFVVVGGTSILLYLITALLAPGVYFEYLSITGGLFARTPQNVPVVYSFGMGALRVVEALVVWATSIAPTLIPALLGAWMTRGYRLKLQQRPEAAAG